jgi:hypothetical protein
VSAGQYATFRNDRDMLEMIAKEAERPKPVKKPWWWVVLSVVCGLIGCALCGAINYLQLGDVPEPTGAMFGLIGATVGFYAIIGWRAGNFEDMQTGEKMVLWIKMGTGLRLLVTAGAVAAFAVGLSAGYWAG